jgi:hypothetical protein
MADGSLQLKTSAEDFYREANKISLQPLRDEIRKTEDAIATQTKISQVQ